MQYHSCHPSQQHSTANTPPATVILCNECENLIDLEEKHHLWFEASFVLIYYYYNNYYFFVTE